MLGGPPPNEPGDAAEAFDRLFSDVLPWTARHHHPRFFARVGSPSNYVSAMADAVAAGFNLIGTSWVAASGPSTVELTVLVRAVPAPGWLVERQRARLLEDGWLDEECDIWDSRGRLVCQARQLASFRV